MPDLSSPFSHNVLVGAAHVTLHLGWDDVALTPALHRVLSYFGFGAPTSGAPRCSLEVLRHGSPLAVPSDAHAVSETPYGLRFYRDEATLYLQYRATVVCIEPTLGRARCVLDPAFGAMDKALQEALLFGVFFYSTVPMLYAHGLRTAHAAALVHEGCGYLFAGQSGSGKSTLAMQLVDQGWDYLTDDSVLLRRTQEGVTTFPLRVDFCLDPDAVAFFPHVAQYWEPHMGDVRKQRYRIRECYPAQATVSCTPCVLVFTRIVQVAKSSLAPLDRKTALVALMQHSGALNLIDARTAAAHLDDLKALIEQVRPYTLRAGRDLRDTPAAAARLLAPLARPHAAGTQTPLSLSAL